MIVFWALRKYETTESPELYLMASVASVPLFSPQMEAPKQQKLGLFFFHTRKKLQDLEDTTNTHTAIHPVG